MSHHLRPLAICAALTMIAAGSIAFADNKIGDVSQKQYSGATGASAGGAASPLYFANDVYSGETVATPDAGSTVLTFQDSTQLRVGGSSRVVLDHFVYDPNTRTGDAAINFSKGIFRFVTGDIQNKSNVKLTTPTTALTIRGTDFKVIVTDAGTIIAVKSGHVEIKPCGGTAETRLLGPGGLPAGLGVRRAVGRRDAARLARPRHLPRPDRLPGRAGRPPRLPPARSFRPQP